MENFFYDKYDEAYSLETVRRLPLTNDELKEALPFQEDRVEYLKLFKELYQEALLFQCHPNLGLVQRLKLSNEVSYPNEVKKKYKALLDFCLLKNLFDYSLYKDFGGDVKEWDTSYFPLSHLTVNVFRYFEFKSSYMLETLDEYRLRIEEYFAQLDNWYLKFRYNATVCFRMENDEHVLRLYRFDDDFGECTFDEAKSLFIKIKNDLTECNRAIEEMSTLKPNENDDDFWDKYHKWFEKRKQLDFEYGKLEECLGDVEDRLNAFPEYDASLDIEDECVTVPKFGQNTILYIYYGDIRCHRDKHSLIQATAIVSGRNGSDVELNVEYCKECDRYLLRYQSFEEYRKRYGLIIGNFRELYNDSFDGDFDLALESPLKLSGYTVSQKEGLNQKERRFILATIIHNEIMTKGEVIRYLNYFIKMQGAKIGNEIALSKWKDDLMFVQEYNKSIQPKVYINEIKRY